MVDPPYSDAKIIRQVSATTNRGVQMRSMNDFCTELSLCHTRHSPPLPIDIADNSTRDYS